MARRNEVLLTQDVLKLGNMGDIVRVAPGYARNYLFPYQLAMPASGAAKRQIEVLRSKASAMEVEREAKAVALKKTVDGISVQIAARVVQDNELFGSVGTKEIVAALAKKGLKVDNKQVHLTDKIKRLGRYAIEVRLHKNVGVQVTVDVTNADPNAPMLGETLAAAGAPVTEAAPAAPAAAPSAAAPVTRKLETKVKNLGRAPEAPKSAATEPAKPEAPAAKGKGAGKPAKH
jgi:large subunit ribosomal protein L9